MTRDSEFIVIPLRTDPADGDLPSGYCQLHRGAEHAEHNRKLIDLLGAVAAGDRDAFTEFYRETSHRVFGMAVRVLRSHAEAEEIVQEVYLQVWSQADRYDHALSSPMGWLMTLAHRRAVDRVRRERAASTRDIVYGHTHLGRDHDVVAEAVDQHLDAEAVLGCLQTLTEMQREALALAYYSGRTYPEVAEQLAVPLPTIKSRIRDGLKRLAHCLSGGDN
ncbi:ECF RNA polymerase sigma factor SigK [Nocardia sp. CA-119907]|uniref:ECF RNA polymerase sigma factor SigK n=1 Tax=Nocardia sp. CA-119907 TaxID=3239973 RepID=UPI003D9649D3